MIDLQEVGVTVRIGDEEETHLLHRTPEEDRQRADIYASLTTTDGAVNTATRMRNPALAGRDRGGGDDLLPRAHAGRADRAGVR